MCAVMVVKREGEREQAHEHRMASQHPESVPVSDAERKAPTAPGSVVPSLDARLFGALASELLGVPNEEPAEWAAESSGGGPVWSEFKEAAQRDELYAEFLKMRPRADWSTNEYDQENAEVAARERARTRPSPCPRVQWPLVLPRCTLPEPALANVRRHWWIRAPLGEALEQEVTRVLAAVHNLRDAFVCGTTQLTRMDGYNGESLLVFPGTRCTPPSVREAADLAQPYRHADLTVSRYHMCHRTGRAVDSWPGRLGIRRARTMVVITHMEMPDKIMMRLLFNAVDVGPEVVRAPEPVPEHERLEEEALRALAATTKPRVDLWEEERAATERMRAALARATATPQPIDWDTWIFDAPH